MIIFTVNVEPPGRPATRGTAMQTLSVIVGDAFGFDSRGNRTNLIDPKQNTTVWEFDGASRQLREKRHLRPSGDGTTAIYKTITTQTNWDANGNPIRLMDDNGGITAWTFDLLDRDVTMKFHDGSTRTKVYNAASNVTGYTDENGSVFANTFDVLGRKVNVGIDPAAGVAGNAALPAIPGTIAQAFQFDGISRPTFGRDSVGTVGVSGVTNADVGATYDSINRVLEGQQTYAGDTRYVTHNAWTSFPSTGFTFPNGRQINVGFDALYRKNAINEAEGGASIAAWQFFGGRIATTTLGNSIVTSFMNNAQTRSAIQQGQTTPAWGDITTDHLGYDGAGRPIGKRHVLSGTTIVGFGAAYDPSSNKLFERALHAESRSSLYGNDSMDRLLQYQRGTLAAGGGSITTPISLPNTDAQRNYALDGLGNWTNTGYTPEGGTKQLELRTHNKLNQITAFGVAPSSMPVLYDHGNNTGVNAARGNGNIIDDGVRLYYFDALNRLILVKRKSDGAAIGAYLYDALNRRIYKTVTSGGVTGTVPDITNRYLYDGQQIVEEVNGPTTLLQYVWGQYIDELVQLKSLTGFGPQPLAAGNYYPLSDLLYRSAALTDGSGIIKETFDTDAYGNTLLFIFGGGTGGAWWTDADTQSAWSACRYVFTGREYDAETGNYFYRARYYGPALGTFIGRDPLIGTTEANLYAALGGRPTAAVDPAGMKIMLVSESNHFRNTVMEAFRSVIGDCAALDQVNHKSEDRFDWPAMRTRIHVFVSSEIGYRDENPKCACNKCWQQLKGAIDDPKMVIRVHMNDKDDPFQTVGTDVYVNPDHQELVWEVDPTGKDMRPKGAYIPFPATVWHEAMGHARTGQQHAGGPTYEQWKFDPGMKGDPVHAIENEGRECLRKSGAMPGLWDRSPFRVRTVLNPNPQNPGERLPAP